jgi:hypothetical protein
MTWRTSFAIAATSLLLVSPSAAQTPGSTTGPAPGGSGPGSPGTPASPSTPTSPAPPGTPGPTTPSVPGTGAPGATTPGTSTPGTNVPGRGRDLGLPCPAGQSRPSGSSMCTPVPPGSPVSPPVRR